MTRRMWAGLLILGALCLSGCRIIDGSLHGLDALSAEETPEPTLTPVPDVTPAPDDPNAEYDFELAPADDPDFGFYAQLNPQAILPIAPATLQEALRADGIASLPTEEGARIRTHTREESCYALEIIGPRAAGDAVVRLARIVAGALAVSEADRAAAFEDIAGEMAQQPCNAIVTMGSFLVRIADLEGELHLMVSM